MISKKGAVPPASTPQAQLGWRPGVDPAGAQPAARFEPFMQTKHEHDVERACFAVKVSGFRGRA